MRSTAHNSPSCETVGEERCLGDPDPPASNLLIDATTATNALHMLSETVSKTQEAGNL